MQNRYFILSASHAVGIFTILKGQYHKVYAIVQDPYGMTAGVEISIVEHECRTVPFYSEQVIP